MSAPLIEFAGIEKAFFGVRVLTGISFTVEKGGAVGLVGENGAGKSTLMNILGGNLAADAGRIRLDGVDFKPASPRDAEHHGIAFIHQELNLFPCLTISENLFLTRFPCAGLIPLINRDAIHQMGAELLREVGLEVSPESLVETLSAGERQLVEVAKALSLDARLIVFDEPTTSLGAREKDRLFALIARLRARGIAILYISHTLAEVFRLCDDIVVLRDGQVVAVDRAKSFSSDQLVSLMVGRAITQLFPERAPVEAREALLEVQGISQPGVLTNISFTLHRGEVLGMAGLMGAGRSECARVLFGLDPHASGEVRLAGESLRRLRPRGLIERGMAFLTENRRAEGLCLDASVADNLLLVTLPRHARTLLRWLSPSSMNAAVRGIRDRVLLDRKTRDAQPVRALSGGSQQKVVLGKWLLHDPRVLILDEPTRGIDVGAKCEIYQLIHRLAKGGTGILVISSELEELMGLCDRILVVRQGELVHEVPRAEFDREEILRAALGCASGSEIVG